MINAFYSIALERNHRAVPTISRFHCSDVKIIILKQFLLYLLCQYYYIRDCKTLLSMEGVGCIGGGWGLGAGGGA
jgi:hypothetical protein